MNFLKIEVNPLSVNKAWQGRRYKSKMYDKFESDVCKVLPFSHTKPIKEEIFVHYIFHVKNFGNADTFNMEKTLTDILVKREYLLDDRYIRAGYVRKERLLPGENEYIEILIKTYDGQDAR